MNKDAVFRPISDDHAIQSVKFALGFNGVISPDALQKVTGAHSQWAESLPAFGLNEMTAEAGPRRIRLPVANFAFLRPDGSANWSMDVGGNQLSVECYLYTRWQRVWDAAFSYMKQVMTILCSMQGDLQLGSIELTVRDVFIAAETDYDLSLLLRRNQSYLSALVFERGLAWHCNTGWFEEPSDTSKTLNQLNADSAPLVADPTRWAVGITHLQQERSAIGAPLDALAESRFEPINVAMGRMHTWNKSVLSGLLQPEVVKAISLSGGVS